MRPVDCDSNSCIFDQCSSLMMGFFSADNVLQETVFYVLHNFMFGFNI